jgi:hypothetical protein
MFRRIQPIHTAKGAATVEVAPGLYGLASRTVNARLGIGKTEVMATSAHGFSLLL